MPIRPIPFFASLAALALVALPALAAESTPTAPELARLARGEVVVRNLAPKNSTAARVWAAVQIAAPIDVVWAVMVDVDHAPEFVPDLRRARRLERATDHEIIEHTVRYSPLLPEFTYRFRADYRRPAQIDFQRISGDLKAMSGTWTLATTAGGTVVTYSVYLDPGFFVPQWLVRQSLRKNLSAVLLAVRNRAMAVNVAPPTAPPR